MSATTKIVKVAHAEVGGAGEALVTVGLGSCVAILLHDPVRRMAGMAHVLLPDLQSGRESANPAKFANTAVPHLVAELERLGADRSRMVARLVGGASLFGSLLSQGTLHTGERNIAAARTALRAVGIPIVGEEVGKQHGRTVHFFPEDGRAVVTSVAHGEVVL